MKLPFRRRPGVLSLAVALMAAAPAVCAQQSQREPPPESRTERRADHRALSDAVRRVERATNGQVLSAERVQFDGRDVNRVKIIDDRGRVRVYWDDPQARRERQERETERSAPQEERTEDPPPRRTRRDDGTARTL